MGRKGRQETGIGEAEATAWMRHSLGFSEKQIRQVLDMPLDTSVQSRVTSAWELLRCLWSRKARFARRRASVAELERWVASHPGVIGTDAKEQD
jgi:hypothetical protein